MPDRPPSPTPAYDVVVCTYNGEDYILAQLESIVRQQPAPSRIIISDDGSTDATLTLIEQYARKSGAPIELIQGPKQGVIRNALSALKHASAPYVFLADQDDIWLDNKAARFCAHMTQAPEAHLIFSDAWVWEPDTDSRTSFWALDGLIPEHARNPKRLAFHNAVQGASACVNRPLIERLHYHPEIAMHDWWLGLIASGTGRVSIIEEPTLLYRQHQSNQVGSLSRRLQTGSRFSRLVQKRSAAEVVLRQAQAFAELYGPQLAEEPKRFFMAYHQAIGADFAARLRFLLRWRPARKNALRTLTLWLSIAAIQCAPVSASTTTEPGD